MRSIAEAFGHAIQANEGSYAEDNRLGIQTQKIKLYLEITKGEG